jgi:anaerobic magnesium-protoporphyrin IX monomethyl ester cyclase
MIDLLLAIPPRIQDDFGYTPAGAALIKGSVVDAGYSCKVLDLNSRIDDIFASDPDNVMNTAIDNFFLFYNFYSQSTWAVVSQLIEQWAEEIVAHNPTWVGLSVFTYNSQRASRLLAIKIKELNPKIKIVIGGGGIATDFNFAETLYEQKLIDAYVRGEGERAILNVLAGDFDNPGINGKASVQIDDIDNIPYPNYDDYQLQTYTNGKGLIALPITGSRGCVRSCTFCDVASMWPKYRFRKGNDIANEIKHQVDKYGVNAFRFTDSLINGSMKAFKDMIFTLAEYRSTLPEHFKFIWDTHYIVRPERHMPPEYFDVMKEAGCGTLLIGVESGSPSVRDHMKKGFKQEDLDYNMEQLDRVGIKCRFLMIVGYPTETEYNFQETLDMFTVYKPYSDRGTIEEVNLGLTLNLLPNTPLTDNLDRYRLKKYNNHINDWICEDNPTLDYKERLRRRIRLQAHVEKLGYNVFEAKNYTKQLLSSWEEVKNINSISKTEISSDDFKFDREKGGITIPGIF